MTETELVLALAIVEAVQLVTLALIYGLTRTTPTSHPEVPNGRSEPPLQPG